MASTSQAESFDNVWHSISADSARIFELSTSLKQPKIANSMTRPSPKLSVTLSVSVSFPVPHSITSDFLSLGIRLDVAEILSSHYLRAVHDVKYAYEEQYKRTDKTCAQVAASGKLLPDFLFRLRESFLSRYMSIQCSWTGEALRAAQEWLLARSLNTQAHGSLTQVKNPFANFATSKQQTLILAECQSSMTSSRPAWELVSDMPSSLTTESQTPLVFAAQAYAPTSSMLPAPKALEGSDLVVLPRHESAEYHPQSSACVGDVVSCLDALHQMSVDTPASTTRTAQVIDLSAIDRTPSHTALSTFAFSEESSYKADISSSPSASTILASSPSSPAPAMPTRGRRRKLVALPKRSIKEAMSPLSATAPTPPSSEFQFKPSEPKLPSPTLHPKSTFAADVFPSSSSVFSPLAPRAPAPSSFLSFALAKDEASAALPSTYHTTDVPVSRPATAHPLFGRPAMAPLPSRHTLGYSETSASTDGSSRSSVVLASSPISRMSSVASDESEGSATVFDHPSTLSSSQPTTDSPPLLPAWSPTSPPPSKGRRRKVAPLPSRHLANEPTFPTFNEKYSREPSFTPTSPPSRAPSLEPAFSDASSSPEPDTLPTPPSSPPGFSFSSPVILSPESHVSEPFLFTLARSRSEHDDSEFHFGSPPPTSKPLQKGRLDFGFPSIDQTLQGSSASISFSFGRPS